MRDLKKTCLLFIFFCGTAIVATAQRGNDSTFKPYTAVNDSLKTFPFRLLPPDFYSTHLGFFCRKELQVEKAVKFPIKFRLGSVAYCDAMEGKHPVYGILPR